ncbi:MAG TPA: ATP-binding cassette domain-containing protein [Candidatus Binatia bacterium]|nr:ATP-binding cassette domain-containing protein [Candidatus Binatia bacterium]
MNGLRTPRAQTSRFFSLSTGQKERVLIARALMVNPKTMIVDEPLSGVDEKSRRSIADLLSSRVKMDWRYFFPAMILRWCNA